MNKKETIADVLFNDSPELKIPQSVAEKFNFVDIKEIRIGDFVYKNPNITITRDNNATYPTRTRNSFRPAFRNL